MKAKGEFLDKEKELAFFSIDNVTLIPINFKNIKGRFQIGCKSKLIVKDDPQNNTLIMQAEILNNN